MSTIITRTGLILATLAGTLVAGCSQAPDVGQPCALSVKITDASGDTTSVDACNAKADWMESGGGGAIVCENLVCILTYATSDICESRTPICSKPCVSDSDCFNKKTGLVCRPVVLDEDLINTLSQTPEGLALLEKYLGDINFSNYCAYPKPHQ